MNIQNTEKMLKNKKSMELSIKALVRIILAAAVLLLIVFPACNKLRSYFFSRDTGSFEAFVDELNEMPDTTGNAEGFVLQINKGSAVVGFSKTANQYVCDHCYPYIYVPPEAGNPSIYLTTINIERPSNQECNGKACVCLCDKGFELELEDTDIESVFPTITTLYTKNGECQKEYLCKELTPDIVEKTIVSKEGKTYWYNGFLFVVGIDDFGFEKYKDEDVIVYAEKRGNLIGVCSREIHDYNKKKWNLDGCINKDKS